MAATAGAGAADASPDAAREGRAIVLGGIAALFAAALCCGLPFLLLAAGVIGAWIGSLTGLEPHLPILVVIPLGLAGFGAWRLHRRRQLAGAVGSCAAPQAERIGLWPGRLETGIQGGKR